MNTEVKGAGMTDGEWVSTLLKHDHVIGDLSKRMTGVESTLSALTTEVRAVDTKLNSGFANMDRQFAEMKGGKGPGLSESMRMVYTGGGIVVMTAGAIMFLVQAYNAHTITKLEAGHASVERREHDERAELQRFRREREESVKELRAAVDDLKARVAWQPTKIEMRR
jgi:flagellar capping protein FliD